MRIQRALVLILILIATSVAAENSLKVDGASEVELEDLTATVFFQEGVGLWMLQLRTPPAYKRTTGSGNTATMFFSKDFELSPGRYPIRFHYRNEANTLGASWIVSGDKRVMFSHDTEGTIEFSRVDDRLEGTFEYTTFDGSEEPRQSVRVQGRFEVDRREALK